MLTTNCVDELSFTFVLIVLHTSDITLNYLKSTNCFDELFFAFDFNVVTQLMLVGYNCSDELFVGE